MGSQRVQGPSMNIVRHGLAQCPLHLARVVGSIKSGRDSVRRGAVDW